MNWYKLETKQAIYRTYHVQAESPKCAEEKLSTNLGDYWELVVDEWEGSEEVTSEDTEEIDQPVTSQKAFDTLGEEKSLGHLGNMTGPWLRLEDWPSNT